MEPSQLGVTLSSLHVIAIIVLTDSTEITKTLIARSSETNRMQHQEWACSRVSTMSATMSATCGTNASLPLKGVSCPWRRPLLHNLAKKQLQASIQETLQRGPFACSESSFDNLQAAAASASLPVLPPGGSVRRARGWVCWW